ncbi:antibiotic biosynthesis monooxygenase family protein [Streptomyces sp. NPDC093675]|uniref:antibiotic biosynthesis monooxygenase family protein n=1 Tax=Streptomyces sp. NPDC093675 TaxID=3366049 RepID=UPI0037F51D32
MFSVLFEVHPRSDQWDAYLGYAKMLKPELQRIDGFVDNIRYGSLTREGWILSLSGWRDEKALVRWRTQAGHHKIQEKGREDVLLDYHLRVGQVTRDTRVPEGYALREQRLDVTESGEGSAVTLIDTHVSPDEVKAAAPVDLARQLGLDETADGFVGWDVFDAVLTPGDVILLAVWRDQAAAEAFGDSARLPEGGRFRSVRVIRDYSLLQRHEAPQYYPAPHHH